MSILDKKKSAGRIRFTLNVLLFIAFMSINSCTKASEKNKFCDIFILNQKNQKIKLNAEIAATDAAQTAGLMFRQELARDSGMLFVFDTEAPINFWMKNTYIPLEIAYINSNGIILGIYSMKPLDTSITYPSKKPAMYALEVNEGWFSKNNITAGSKIFLNGCISK